MSKEKSCLILDADHDSLTTNFKKIYLGYWCLENYNNPKDEIRVIKFKNKDVQRHNVIKTVLDIYG